MNFNTSLISFKISFISLTFISFSLQTITIKVFKIRNDLLLPIESQPWNLLYHISHFSRLFNLLLILFWTGLHFHRLCWWTHKFLLPFWVIFLSLMIHHVEIVLIVLLLLRKLLLILRWTTCMMNVVIEIILGLMQIFPLVFCVISTYHFINLDLKWILDF